MLLVTTDPFLGLGQLEARALGMPDLRFVVLPHPFGGLKPNVVLERSQMVAEAALKLLSPAPMAVTP